VRVLERGGRADGAQLLAPTRAVILPPDRSRHWVGGLDDGADLDVDAYVEQYVNPNEYGAAGRWYGELRPSAGRLAVGLLVDGSASIRDRAGSPLRAQLLLAGRLGASLDTRGDPWGTFVFRSHSRSRVEVIVAKDFCSPRPLVVSADAARPSGATRLGAGLRHATRRLLAVPAEFRVLVSMGDAKPYDEGYEGRYADADVRRAVEEARMQGVTVFHLSVSGRGDRGESLFGRGRHLQVRNYRDLHAALARIYEQHEE
jgi:nitric oxide reductase NorD protein